MKDRPTLENHARELLKMPLNWKAFRFKRMPEDAVDTTHTLVTGAVCLHVYASGPRKGGTNWSKRDPSTERSVIISDAESASYRLLWEETTGNCHKCGGDGQEWTSWHHITGHAHAPCRRCNATGKSPATAA